MIEAADFTGHWRRDWLEASGRRDDTTAVHWLQTPDGYVDLRVPAGLKRLAGSAPADLPAEDLALLMTAEGFAGTIAVDGGVCTWTRAIDWHGASEAADVGRMSWDEDGALIETGVEANYAERWLRQSDSGLGSRVLTDGPWRLQLAWSDEALAMGVEEPGAPASAPLREALGRGERPLAAIERQFRGEFTLARWDSDRAVATLSTHPMRAGAVVLRRADLGARTLRLGRLDAGGDVVTEDWCG